MSNALSDINSNQKPYYTIYFKAVTLGTEIRVNDIPVFTVDNTNNMSLEIPVSSDIINGTNQITVITYPYFNDNDEQTDDYLDFSEITVGLYVREDGEPDTKRTLISEATIKPHNAYTDHDIGSTAAINPRSVDSNNADLKIKKDSSILTYPFYGTYKKQVVTTWNTTDIKTPFPQWEWQSGTQITDSQDTYESLLSEYKELFDAFQKKDLKQLKQLSIHRSSELATAYFLKDADAGFDYSAIGEYIDHPRAELYKELRTRNTKLMIFANGKLATIKNAAGSEPVLFVDYKDRQVHNMKSYWYKNKEGKWVIIR